MGSSRASSSSSASTCAAVASRPPTGNLARRSSAWPWIASTSPAGSRAIQRPIWFELRSGSLTRRSQSAIGSRTFTCLAGACSHAVRLAAGDRHARNQHRPDVPCAPAIDVVAECDDVLEHLLQVAGDGDFLDRISDLSVLDPETRGTTLVVAGDRIDALAELLGDEQPASHPSHQRVQVFAARNDEVVRAARIAGRTQTELARRVTAE